MYISTQELLSRYIQGERNFSGLKLCDLDLSGLDLKGIDLSKADLRRTNLSRTNLAMSALCNASLLEANLEEANLKGADLTGAICNLYAEGWVIWIGLPDNPEPYDFVVDLAATVFPEGFAFDRTGLRFINKGDSLENVDLTNFDLSGIDFGNINLEGANLKGANLSYSNLSNALLKNANLENTNLKWTCLTSAKLINSNLSDANICHTYLDDTDLSGCDLSNANIQSINYTWDYDNDPTIYDKRTKFPNGFIPQCRNFKLRKNRIISPNREELGDLRTPLTFGEEVVLNFFDDNLSEDWEIYIQPHVNGLRPDFVLLNPNIGIAVFEVKDWNLNAMSYRVQQIEKKSPELWATSKDGVDFRVKDNPVEKVALYKESIANLYCPQIDILNTENKEKLFQLDYCWCHYDIDNY